MGHRLSKIATRTGDAGETGLGDGRRVAKDNARVAALGDIDELNSAIGVLLAAGLPQEPAEALQAIQQDLLDLGGEISIPGHVLLPEERVARLEQWLEAWNGTLPPLAHVAHTTFGVRELGNGREPAKLVAAAGFGA